MCFSETWLNDKITNNNVAMDGFEMFRMDRQKVSGKKKGGGVCTYVNRNRCHPA